MREGEALLARLEASQAEAEEQKARLITDIAALGAQLKEMEAAGSQERSQLLTRTLTLTRTPNPIPKPKPNPDPKPKLNPNPNPTPNPN